MNLIENESDEKDTPDDPKSMFGYGRGIHKYDDSSLPLEQGFLNGDLYSWWCHIDIGVYRCI